MSAATPTVTTAAAGPADLGRPQLLPLFLVALASVGYEIALTRWFAIVSWSEYGYWVISITMVGIAASGVVLNLAKDWVLARPARVHGAFAWLPPLMMLSLAGGYLAIAAIDFNPLALQNHATMGAQLVKIAAYYAALFPFFFLSGAFIGLYFIAFGDDISRIYAADLVGAGAAGVVVVALMFVLHPFALPLALLPVLLWAGWLLVPPASARAWRAGLVALALACAACVGLFARADYNEYKAIAAPLRVEGSQRVAVLQSPRGIYEVLDNFTERLDVDLSNNEAMLGGAEPIATYGLYVDGNRLTSLPKRAPADLPYLNAALDALPYRLAAQPPSVLLVGSRGGFRLDEAKQLGARRIVALEPEPTLHALIGRYRPDLRDDPRRLPTAPSAYLSQRAAGDPPFDLVDIALDYQGSSDVAKYSFTVEGLAAYHAALSPSGMVSVPMSIREFTVYAVKLVLTAREALRAAGVAEPARHIVVVRSAWNARVLISKQPFSAEAIATIRRFCDERSFDISHLPGTDLSQAKIWNDLPAISFEEVQLGAAGERRDALADEIRAFVLPPDGVGRPWPAAYDLSPATTDRPHFFSVLRLTALNAILERIDLVPREEIGALVSLAVLAQSVVIALLVLSLPLFRPKTMGIHPVLVGKSIAYFAGLGLGFLFIEIYLIEKATFFLNDRTLGFSLTLGAMLLFSGLGSWLSGRWAVGGDALRIRHGLRMACVVILAWCALAFALAAWLLPLALGWPLSARIAVLLVLIAPVGLALGFPFACGLAALQPYPHFVPWAWSLNGAFSVVASPLAHLLAMGQGNRALVAAALALYLLVWLWLPLEKAVAGHAAPAPVR
ncbi:MAG: hypothetical protein JNL30_19930 [Rubrivivax sp.]|nr:hypothetical protein [Rubrivivax sp.]